MRAIVTGMIATYPVGGVLWDYGQYLLGLERLGFEVYYLEDTGWQSYDPRLGLYGEDASYGVEFLKSSLQALSPTLGQRWHFRSMHGQTFGLSKQNFLEIINTAGLFLNVSNSALLRDEYMSCPKKAMVDTDPGYNHFVNFPKWDKNPGWHGAQSFRRHDYFFTYAERTGRADCQLPTLGLNWLPTRPPVVLDCWSPEPSGEKWTTVMTWNNFREPIEHNGLTYGSKEMEFGRVENLPALFKRTMEVAVGGSGVPRDHWKALGWNIRDSHEISKTPEAYRSYVQSSRGEFSVAKNIYAATRSGWFSCRSVCYLAASRPVVVQDTGFSEIIPTGKGLLSFTTQEEAIAALEEVEGNYAVHQEAAREIAHDYFDSDVVLGDMLKQVGLG